MAEEHMCTCVDLYPVAQTWISHVGHYQRGRLDEAEEQMLEQGL